MKLIKIALVCSIVLSLTGCASIAGNNSRQVKVTSNPSGARIFVDNKQYGTTPSTITLPSDIYGGKTVTLKKSGYQNESMVVNSKFQPIALLDVLFWPTLIVDGATGNLVKIDPANTELSTNLQRA